MKIENRVIVVAKIALVLFVACVVGLTLWPLDFNLSLEAISHKWSRAEWQVFYYSRGSLTIDLDLVLNIVFFVPLGVLICFSGRPRKLGVTLLLALVSGFLLSLSVEAAQLLTPARVTQLADLWRNTVGALLGALVGWPLCLALHNWSLASRPA